MDELVVMQWAQQAWSTVTHTTISNCWRHTNILDEDMYELTDGIDCLHLCSPSLSQILK